MAKKEACAYKPVRKSRC